MVEFDIDAAIQRVQTSRRLIDGSRRARAELRDCLQQTQTAIRRSQQLLAGHQASSDRIAPEVFYPLRPWSSSERNRSH